MFRFTYRGVPFLEGLNDFGGVKFILIYLVLF